MDSGNRFALHIYPKGDTYKEVLFLPDGSSLGETDLFTLMNKYQVSLPGWDQDFSVDECIQQLHLSVFGADNMAKFATQVTFVPFTAAYSLGLSTVKLVESSPDSDYERQARAIGDSLIRECVAIDTALGDWLYLAPGNRSRSGSARKPLPSQRFAQSFRIGRKEYVPLKDTEEMIRDLNYAWHTLDWFDPDYFSQKYSQTIKESAWEVEEAITLHTAMDHRLKQLQHTSTVVNTGRKDVRARVYLTDTSNGIFPLLWAEIDFALDNDIYVRDCKECSKIFALPRGRLKQLTCTGYKGGCGKKITEEKKHQNPYHKEIQRLMTRRTRTRSPEEKDDLTRQIKALRAKAKALGGQTGQPTKTSPDPADR